MSGRSAVVRKKNAETKPRKGSTNGRPPSTTSSNHDEIPDFPLPPVPTGTPMMSPNQQTFNNQTYMMPQMVDPRYATQQGWGNVSMHGQPMMMGDLRYMAGGQAGYPQRDPGYARPRKTSLKEDEETGIEKSGLRSMLDKKSDGVRRGLAKTFTFRKKERDDEPSGEKRTSGERPPSTATARPNTHDERYVHPIQTAPPPIPYQYQQQQQALPSPPSPQNPWDAQPIGPPPTTRLPPIPQLASSSTPIKRWLGAGRPVAKWNKLRKDPELWDPNGDVLVFLGRKGQAPKQPPSFRLSSHIIEATESRYLVTLLREGSTEEDMYLPPSPSPYLIHLGPGRDGLLTPPISESTSLRDELEGQISYEMYFPPPTNLNRVDQLRHQITTRNVFAVLYHASLVGMSLHQALSDLHTRLDSYMPPGNDNVAQIVKYLRVRGIDDVRGDAATAVSLLAWAESPDVRWEDGWRECFTHSAGMDAQLDKCPDFKYTTPIARALLERARLETQLRVQAAEERLGEFSYADMWTAAEGAPANGPTKTAADRFRDMLQSHYARIYGSWPPSQRGSDGESGGDDMWLTRTVAMALQRDFGALYDYLVDRDIVWDVSEARSGRKWMMASESGNQAFEADSTDAPMTDMLIEFDNKLRFPHIPHPYPLIPESIPPSLVAASTGREGGGGLFKSSKKAEPVPNLGRSGALERRVQLAYTESTNIYALGSDFVQSDLVDAFVRFEKGDRVGEIDPADGRRGRWVLIYGILQTLASVSVDEARLRYTEGVKYHLGPRLKGTKIPPWKRGGRKGGDNGSSSSSTGSGAHERSHCWAVPQTWGVSGSGSGRGSEGEGEYDDNDEEDFDEEYAEYFEGELESNMGSAGSEMGIGRRAVVVSTPGRSDGSRAGSAAGSSGMGPLRVRASGSGSFRDRAEAGAGAGAGARGQNRGNGAGRGTTMGWNGNGDGPRGQQSIESFITAL